MMIDIQFSAKEVQIIELMNPGKTADEVVNIVLRTWFDSNVYRLSKEVFSQEAVLDQIIEAKSQKIPQEEEVSSDKI